jgi:Fe-S cluster assembly protein SufD
VSPLQPLAVRRAPPRHRAGVCAPRALAAAEAVDTTAAAEAAPEATGSPAWLGSVLRSRGPVPESAKLAAAVARGVGVAEGGGAMPGRRQEPWRFTNLNLLYQVRVGEAPTAAGAEMDGAIRASVERLVASEVGAVLVFLDGCFMPGASRVDDPSVAAVVAAGGHVGGLDGYDGDVDAVLESLEKGEVGAESGGMFAAVSSALARDICVVDVPAGVSMSKPLAVVCLTTGGASETAASASAPRVAVKCGAGASVTLLETHGATDADARPWACVLSASAIDVADGGSVEHYLVNDASPSAHHVAHVHADVAKDGTYKLRSLALGGQVGRVSLGIDLNGEGAHGEAFGVMIADGNRVTDLHSRISHNAPACTSNQYQKNIASDRGHVVFSGKILVQKVAQETDSQQLCRSMLLSNTARVDAMPVLEISADQVKCTHGATVSDLSQEELFYCQSRGISEVQAQELLIASFALDVLDDCPFGLLKERTTRSARELIPSIQKVGVDSRSELYQSI